MKLYTCKRVRASKPKFDRWALVYEEATPAELAGILKGKAWVLEELKKYMENYKCEVRKLKWNAVIGAFDHLKEVIQRLESQAPVSELAKQAKENERKAGKWKDLYFRLGMEAKTSGKIKILDVIHIVDELLAQPEIPPKAEERG